MDQLEELIIQFNEINISIYTLFSDIVICL